MEDRDFLKLAAKAAGLPLSSEWDSAREGILIGEGAGDLKPWNPLADNGEALQLAVTLRLWLHVEKYGASARRPGDAWLGCEAHKYGGIEAATRRAIVRVAAAIGKEQ
ncbi:hypothetical protein IB259_00090 [Achromobacter sp. ACM04]|uniref:hypothetical protein n=1 Tax=Achromobacter sp. ACM04 TaxID=2769312 RepID=UPI00177D12DB|nr:hypothetical protein [Achromobacter sp. ACM04]MBD9417618.1 hypothetical protein [Achromobacter sp. ACM04]